MGYNKTYIEQTAKTNELTITIFYLVNLILCFGCVVTAVNLITTFWLYVYVSLKTFQGVFSGALVFRTSLCIPYQAKQTICIWLAITTFLSILVTAGYLHVNGGVYPRPANMLYFGWRFYTVIYTVLLAYKYTALHKDFLTNKKIT